MERLVYNRLISFVNKYSTIAKQQFGFRKNHSTSDALIYFNEHILYNTSKRLFSLAVFIDYSKAFDDIDHKIILNKRNRYRIRGTALHWFESYLTATQLCVHYNNITSSLLSVLHGVPQGSILGPLMFNIFANDLPLIIYNASVILYADVTLIIGDTNINIAFQNMQTVLDCISR